MSNRIIITGGSGFLGKHLCRAVAAAGYEVINIDLKDNPEFPAIKADIRDPEAMKNVIKDALAVFHLAAFIEAGESVKEPAKFIENNIIGSLNVLEAMKANDIKNFLFSSSAAVYGNPISTPIKEDDRTIPINPYGMTKLAMEGLVSSYVATSGLTGVALRYFNLYGPEEHHEPETHAIPRFISQITRGEEVTVWGNGEHQRDYIYISDIVDAHLKALDFALANQQAYHYFNLSTEQATRVIDVIHLIEKITNRTAKITNFPYRPGDPLVLIADATKAHQQLGWQSQVNLEQGLTKTIEYFSRI